MALSLLTNADIDPHQPPFSYRLIPSPVVQCPVQLDLMSGAEWPLQLGTRCEIRLWTEV